MDRGLDPPQRIGGKPGAAAGLKMRGRDDEAEIGLADQIGKRKVVSLVAARDLCRQAEMAGDERVGRAAVAMLLPASGKLLLPRLFKQDVSLDERGVFIDETRAICLWSTSPACLTSVLCCEHSWVAPIHRVRRTDPRRRRPQRSH